MNNHLIFRDLMLRKTNLSRINRDIFYPESIAIFGPSARRGFYWIYSLIDTGFNGAIYPIHPSRKSGAGLPFYKSALDVPGSIDYAIVAVPAKYVLDVINDCVTKTIKFVHIFSSGFSEIGEQGNELEDAVLKLARENDILINGPNCLGIYCPKSGLSFRSDLFQHGEGKVSFISQSGGIANNLVLRGHKQNLLFSKVISLGNSIDLKIMDYLEYLAEDPETTVIGIYIENLGRSLEDGRRLYDALKYANLNKPVVVWRGGRTLKGSHAAASHTGAIASNENVWQGLVKQTGIISVHTFEEMVDTLNAFDIVSTETIPKGPNLGLITISGGVGVTNADLLTDIGLNLPSLSKKTISKIETNEYIASVGISTSNPIDLGGSFLNLNVVDTVIRMIIADEYIDSIIIEISNHYIYDRILLLNPEFNRQFMRTIAQSIMEVRKLGYQKPIFLVMPIIAYEWQRIFDRDFFVKKGIPVFDNVEKAGQAIFNLYQYKKFMNSVPARKFE